MKKTVKKVEKIVEKNKNSGSNIPSGKDGIVFLQSSQLNSLEKELEEIYRRLDEQDRVREIILKEARQLVRECSKAIKNIHLYGASSPDVNNAIKNAEDVKKRLDKILEQNPLFYSEGFVENGFQEYAEMHLFYSLITDADVSSPTDLNISVNAYLYGLADAAGELRRYALELANQHDFDRAWQCFLKMERIYDLLQTFHFPAGLVNIRQKQDTLRSLVDKTRGEMMLLKSMYRATTH